MAPSVVLFVAARKGSQQKQKSTLKACDPVVTLRQLAASILGPDAEVGRVEAAAKLGGETTNFTVDDLGYTAHFLQECGLRFIEIVFVDDEPLFVAARAAGASAEQSALTALMREEKRKSVLYHWPALYADSRNCRSTRNVANALITAGMKDPVKYGGFASQTEADDCQSIFWGLAEVLLWAMPHVAKFESRSMPLPQLFVDAALDVYVNSANPPVTSVDYAKLEEQIKIVAAMQRDGVLGAKFRMSIVLEELCKQFERYAQYLQQQRSGEYREGDHVEDKEYGCIRRDNRDNKQWDSSHEATMLRINEMLAESEPYVPVKIDDLLLSELDLKDAKYPRTLRTRRLRFVLNEVNAIWCCVLCLTRCAYRHNSHMTPNLIVTTSAHNSRATTICGGCQRVRRRNGRHVVCRL